MPLRSQLPLPLIQDIPLHELLFNSLGRHDPDAILLTDSETSRDYAVKDIVKAARGVASALVTAGLRKGDVVAYCMRNCPQVAFALLGTWMIGGVTTGINADYTNFEFRKCFEITDTKYVITTKTHLKAIHESAIYDGTKVQMIFLMDEDAGDATALPKQVVELGAMAENAEPVTLPTVHFWTKTDVLMMLFSSGTTGQPKAVMLSHYGFSGWTQVARNMPTMIVPTQRDVIISFLPFFHIFGVYTLVNALDTGYHLVTMATFRFERFLQLVQQYKVRHVYAVPRLLQRLVKEQVTKKYDLSSIQHVTIGAAPVSQELCEEMVAKFPHILTVTQGYGLTETGAASNISPALPISDTKFNSCGLLTPMFEAKVIDPKTGAELGCNQPGEICFKGPFCCLGYYNAAKNTAEVYDKDGWLHTGDVGYYDEDEFFYIVDRMKELIKVKGFQVHVESDQS